MDLNNANDYPKSFIENLFKDEDYDENVPQPMTQCIDINKIASSKNRKLSESNNNNNLNLIQNFSRKNNNTKNNLNLIPKSPKKNNKKLENPPKEIFLLQNELKKVKLLRKKDLDQISILKKTINNLMTPDKQNIINQNETNNSIKSYADFLLMTESLTKDNEDLINQNTELLTQNKKIKNELIETKKILKFKEEKLNQTEKDNTNLTNNIKILDTRTSRLQENLKDFNRFEEMKKSNETLNELLTQEKTINQDYKSKIIELEKEISELKFLKYDDKLYILEKQNEEFQKNDKKKSALIENLQRICEENSKNIALLTESLENNKIKILETEKNYENYLTKYNDLKTNYDLLVDEKTKNFNDKKNLSMRNIELNTEIDKIKIENDRHSKEVANLNNQIVIVQNEKNKNEIYYLNQISLLQQEKLLLEKQLNNLRQKNIENKIILTENNKLPENGIEMSERKYGLALQEIKNYRNDNQKLIELSSELKDEIFLLNLEKNFYLNLINKISNENFYQKKYDNIPNILKQSINNNIEIINTQKLYKELNLKLVKYQEIIDNMNKKPETCVEIVNNFYDAKDFTEIADIQNKMMVINQKIEMLKKDKKLINEEFNKIFE